MPKGKQDSVDKSNSSKNEVVRASSKCLDSSSSVMPKGRNDALMPNERPDAVDDSIGSLVNGAEACSDTGNVTSNLKNMSLTVKSGYSTNVSARGANSQTQYKPEKWMLPDKTGDRLTQLNVAIVGHVDAGKSTLSGRMLYLLGRISQKLMCKYEKEAKMQGKTSFAYAWVLDETAEEREWGITLTVAVAYFDSKKYHVVVLDSLGHNDFVPNLISGATHSDAAILVIDVSVGAFEVGMENTKGQTREHAQLVRSFCVDQLIVAVNKMDADSSVTWIPLSAMENQNLVTAPDDVKLLSWYQGPCLLDAIDSLQSPSRDFLKPLLMPICDVKLQHGHVSACGKLEAGALQSGLNV